MLRTLSRKIVVPPAHMVSAEPPVLPPLDFSSLPAFVLTPPDDDRHNDWKSEEVRASLQSSTNGARLPKRAPRKRLSNLLQPIVRTVLGLALPLTLARLLQLVPSPHDLRITSAALP